MDFLKVVVEPVSTDNKRNQFRVKPDFIYGNTKDLITKGGSFYAFWDGQRWSRSIEHLCKKIDREVYRVGEEFKEKSGGSATMLYTFISSAETRRMALFIEYCKNSKLDDQELDTVVKFASDEITREDYSTRKVDYDPIQGETPAFDELINTLYEPSEKQKIMWFIGAALSGDMYKIQKMLYLYGGKGTGKSTIINVISQLFVGYSATINLRNLTSSDPFATSEVQNIPLLVDHDTDLKSIYNDTNLLKLVSHENITVNKKYKEPYYVQFQGLLVCASNQRFSVRNTESGITRRVVVARPSGKLLDRDSYDRIIRDVRFESSAIAFKCMDLYSRLGHKFYDKELDVDIVEDADFIFRFVRTYYTELISPEGILLSRAHKLFIQFLEEDYGTDLPKSKAILREGLKLYFKQYSERKVIEGQWFRNWYGDLDETKVFPENFTSQALTAEEEMINISENMFGLVEGPSIFDEIAKDYPAQLANSSGNPIQKWEEVTTTLSQVDTSKLHWVRVPLNHIVLDFDLKDDTGEKSLELNIQAAMEFPTTYAEVSKSGKGLHLHYIYEGNVNDLSSIVKPGIEIKVYRGNSSLRRINIMSNNEPIRTISSGLPFKPIKETEMYTDVKDIIWNEKTLRQFIINALHNKHHANTRPEIMFIIAEMTKAKEQGLKYDLTDLRDSVIQKAMMSTNHKNELVKLVLESITWNTIKDDEEVQSKLISNVHIVPKEDIVFYDIEVYPNLFVVVWKKYHDDEIVRWVNPTPDQIEYLLSFPLVGFNNRRYDNHILYGRTLGASNMDLFIQSNRIINEKNGQAGFYSAAYELSYADIYEYVQKKQSLKKWQVELGLSHVEMEIPWDQPVPDHLVDTVVEYCVNDVITTEALFDATYADYVAREVLATLCGGSMNATNNGLTTRFIFGEDKNPQEKLVYTRLETIFPGYTFSFGKSQYRGIDPSEGGYVYTEPGVYRNVSLNDVTSMHPNSAINLNYFGPYTERYKSLLDCRVWIKHKDFDTIREVFPQISKYLENPDHIKTMDKALKIPINSVYGLTSASFDNKCRHPLNKDNIIAKRGALFMIDLQFAVQEQGYKVCHIKTDSIKVPDSDEFIEKFISDFGAQPKYNYGFEREHVYSKFCLIDKAQYICKDSETGEWDSTGALFKDPYLFKRVWSKEVLTPEDYMLTFSTKGHLYLGDEFVGKVGKFYASKTGKELRWTEDKENFKYLSGTKGVLFRHCDDYNKDDVDYEYYNQIAISTLSKICQIGLIKDILDEPLPKDLIAGLEEWYSLRFDKKGNEKKWVNDFVRMNFNDEGKLVL